MVYEPRLKSRAALLFGCTALWATGLHAQDAETGGDDYLSDDVVFLSPFEVNTSEGSEGYTSSETLAGTRLRTNLEDVATSLSVVTEKFLQDTGATDARSLLVYTPNTEVGGLQGNFSGMGGSSTYNENNALLRPSQNNRVRGLTSADNTRDFFLSEIPWDNYNVDRVEMQRGANSILFGVGSPAGIVNTATKTATFNNSGEFQTRVGQYGSVRGSLDINRELIDDELAIRIIGLYDNEEFQQHPAFEKDRRVYGTLRWEPKILGPSSHTTIRISGEAGDIDANRPRTLPPIDGISPWFLTGEQYGYANPNKITLDPTTTYNQYGKNSDYPNGIFPWFTEGSYGRMINYNIGTWYNANNETPLFRMMPTAVDDTGIGPDGAVDGTISGLPFVHMWAIGTYNNYARAVIPGGKYYSNVSLSDPTVFDFYNNLIDGDNKREWQNWTDYNFSVAQTFLDNRVGFELAGFVQNYEDGQYSFLQDNQYIIGIDINEKLGDGSVNENLGRPYVASSGQYGSSQNFIDRESFRATAYGEFHATDVLQESLLTRILGRHILSGLVSRDVRENDYRSFSRWAWDSSLAEQTGQNADITRATRQYDWLAYLGPSLLNASSAHGAYLSPVTAKIDPTGPVSARYFDPHWNAPGVDPAAEYVFYSYNSEGELEATTSTQSENPANYVGWTNGTFNVLNAEKGDKADLYSSVQKSYNRIMSQGLTLQSFLLDESVVVTYGWRQDKVKSYSSQGPKLAYDVSDPDFNLTQENAEKVNYADGQSRTWGVVVHAPQFLTKHLPYNTRFSVFYGEGENFKADAPRGDIFGNQISNPEGDTQDYGFILSTLDGRVSFKTTWYETKMHNATLAGDSAGFSSSLYYVWALPYWEATHSLAVLEGMQHPTEGDTWLWNSIATDGNGDPDVARITEIASDFFKSFPLNQRFADEYGLSMDVSAMRNGNSLQDWLAAVPDYTGTSELGLQPAYSGNLRSFGSGPVASVDTTSEGVEFELSARVTDNWNVMINASKTEAQYDAISPTIAAWIDTYTDFMNGDAGLVKLWGGSTFRQNWEDNVLAPYSVLMSQIGQSQPEIAPWRFNIVSSYNFTHGFLSGVWVGGAYRWEDKRILGYQYDATSDTLDTDKPWYGPTDDHFDLWVGYGRELNDGINWRIQLNMRNVGESTGLVPVTKQPDGSVALSRIQQGMSWFVTNTFTF